MIKKKKKRVGRGPGSGHGKTSCRGHKGQRSRSGGRTRPGFEGGQMPLIRRLPKRGFTNIFKKSYEVINLSLLDRFDKGKEITPELLRELKVIKKREALLKVLAGGTLSKPLTVKAHAFSKEAIKKIEAAGGKVKVIGAK